MFLCGRIEMDLMKNEIHELFTRNFNEMDQEIENINRALEIVGKLELMAMLSRG